MRVRPPGTGLGSRMSRQLVKTERARRGERAGCRALVVEVKGWAAARLFALRRFVLRREGARASRGCRRVPVLPARGDGRNASSPCPFLLVPSTAHLYVSVVIGGWPWR